MSDFSLNLLPTAGQGMPETLAVAERRRISVRLGAGIIGVGLLGLGTFLVHVFPDQFQVGEIFRAAAAAVVGIPTLISGVRGIVTGETRGATDQLVSIAILAAAASGDFVTATLIPLFLELGRLFEERSSLGARAAIDGIRALDREYRANPAVVRERLYRDAVEKALGAASVRWVPPPTGGQYRGFRISLVPPFAGTRPSATKPSSSDDEDEEPQGGSPP